MLSRKDERRKEEVEARQMTNRVFGGNCGKAVALGEGTEKRKDSQSRVLSDKNFERFVCSS